MKEERDKNDQELGNLRQEVAKLKKEWDQKDQALCELNEEIVKLKMENTGAMSTLEGELEVRI